MPTPQMFKSWPKTFPARVDYMGVPVFLDNIHDGDTFHGFGFIDQDAIVYRSFRLAGVNAVEKSESTWEDPVRIVKEELGNRPIAKARMFYKTFDRWATQVTLPDGRDLAGVLLARGVVELWPEVQVAEFEAFAEVSMAEVFDTMEDSVVQTKAIMEGRNR